MAVILRMHSTVVSVLAAEAGTLLANSAIFILCVVARHSDAVDHAHEAKPHSEGNRPHDRVCFSVDEVLQVVEAQVLVSEVVAD